MLLFWRRRRSIRNFFVSICLELKHVIVFLSSMVFIFRLDIKKNNCIKLTVNKFIWSWTKIKVFPINWPHLNTNQSVSKIVQYYHFLKCPTMSRCDLWHVTAAGVSQFSIFKNHMTLTTADQKLPSQESGIGLSSQNLVVMISHQELQNYCHL